MPVPSADSSQPSILAHINIERMCSFVLFTSWWAYDQWRNEYLLLAEAEHTLDRGSMQVDWVLNKIEQWQCMPPSHSSAGRAKVCNWKSVFDHLRSRVRITVAGHFYDVTHFFAHSRAPSPAGVSAILGSSRLAESMKPYDCTLRPF